MLQKDRFSVVKLKAIQKYLARHTATRTRRFQQDISTDVSSDTSSSESTEYAEQKIQHTTSDLVETAGDVALDSGRISYMKFRAFRDKRMARQEQSPSETPFEPASETECFNSPNHSFFSARTPPQSTDPGFSAVSFSETAHSENPHSALSPKTQFRPSRTTFEQETLKSFFSPEGNSIVTKTASPFESISELQKSQLLHDRQTAHHKNHVIQEKAIQKFRNQKANHSVESPVFPGFSNNIPTQKGSVKNFSHFSLQSLA